MKMLEDEFGSSKIETNKAIAENLNIPAIEYYKGQEVSASPLEVKQINEDSSSKTEGSNAEAETASRAEKLNEANEQFDRVNNARNTADGLKSPDINATEAVADGSGATVEAAAEASAASASVTSTVATLAGPISVIAAAAVGMAAVTGGVLEKEPDIISEYYEVGTNYIKYEIDVDSLSEDMEYIIRVSNPTFNKEFKIEAAGMQRQIVTGLKPYRSYDVEIIGISKEIGEIPYYKHTCGTNQLPMPKAVFQFEPHFDYVLGKIDLDYEAFISDFYNAGGNEYLQIYVGNKLLVDNHNLPEDHFFKGTIRNINQINDITAVAYSDYYDGKDLYEGIEIGRYGYEIDLPKDFSFETSYKAIYTFDNSCFYNNFDFASGNTLTVNTNFTHDEDPDELYRLDVYNAGDLDLNPDAKPINSIVSNEKEVSLVLDSFVKYVDVKFTQLKRKGDDLVEYDSSLVKYVEIDPKIMSEEEFRISPFGYFYNMYINEEYTGYGDVNVKFTKNYKDGTSVIDERSEGETVSIEGNYDDNKGLSDLESIDLEIKYNNIMLENTRIYNNVSITLDSFDIDDEGNILIPYEIDIPANAKLESMWAYINFAEMDEDYDKPSGTLLLKSISSNVISGAVSINYNINGRVITKEIDIDEFNLGAEVSVSYYATHYNSYYDTMNIKFDTTIDGKNVNVDPSVYVLDNEDYVSLANRSHPYDISEYMGYYVVNSTYDSEVSGYCLKYKFMANGFSDEVYTIPQVMDISDRNSDFGSVSAGYLSNNKPYVDYLKTTNSDGTVNYIFNTMFESETGKHYGRIEYEYTVDGVIKYGVTDFLTDNYIKLENLEDLDYNFHYQLYYLEDGLYYDVDPRILVDGNIVKKDINPYYECHEVKNSETLDLYNATIAKEVTRDGLTTYIDFSFDLTGLSKDTPISINYGSDTYSIPFKSSTDDGVQVDPNTGSYAYSNAPLEQQGDEVYPYIYYVVMSDTTMRVELVVNDEVTAERPNTTTVSFGATPKKFVDTYNIANPTDTISIDKLKSNETVTIGEFIGALDYENYQISDYGVYGGQYTIHVENISFKSKDERDKLRVDVYSGNKVVASKLLDSGVDGFSIYVDQAYYDVTLKFVEVKVQTLDILMGSMPDTYQLEFNTSEFTTYSITPEQVIDSLNVDIIDENVVIEAIADDFNDYKIEAIYYAKQFENSSYTEWKETGEVGVNNLSFSKMSGVRSITVNILKEGFNSDIVYATYEIVFDATIGEYIYNEGDDSIALPYELLIPDGATLGPDAALNDMQLTSKTGNYQINELDSNIVELNFNISYELNGCSVNYSFSKSVELEYETVLIDEINSFLGNSSYGSFSLQYCYIDENGTPYYSAGNGEYKDESGNLKPDNAIWGERVNTIYTYSGNVVNKIGCFNVPYDKEYEIQVKTSGVNLLNSETGNVNSSFSGRPDEAVSSYTLSSNDVSGIYLTFLHTILNEYYDGNVQVIGQSKCELEFDILVDGEVLFTKKIEFTEPGEDSTLGSNTFNYDSSLNEASKNSDGTINLTITTGFDSTINPNYEYKLRLYEKTDFYFNEKQLVYESDYLDSNTVSISNLKNTNYVVEIVAYYVENGNYVNVGTYADLGYANSALTTDWEFDYDTTTYTNILILDKNYINKDYLDGTKQLEIDLNGGTGSIDLSNTTSEQTIGFDTIEVTDSDGIITVRISATSNSDRVRGNITLSQGNEEIGYTDITYSI